MTGSQLCLDGTEEHAADAALDQWFTPPDIARRMVAEAARWCLLPPRVLEPSSGAGAISECLARRFPFAELTRYEIDPALCARTGATEADFLRVDGSLRWDLCVMNPPYSNGRDGEFLAKAAEQCEVVVALIRTHALHGVDRHAAVWSKRGARRVNLFVRRPSFDGPTDGNPQHEFCVVVIGPGIIPAGVEWW